MEKLKNQSILELQTFLIKLALQSDFNLTVRSGNNVTKYINFIKNYKIFFIVDGLYITMFNILKKKNNYAA